MKGLRNEKNLTQEQLSEKFGVSRRTVSRWETGHNMPDLSLLIELADYYDVDIREIIDGERKSEKMNEEMRGTLEKVAEYTDSEKEEIIKKMYNNNLIALAALFMVYAVMVSPHLPSYFLAIQAGCVILAFFSVGESLLYAKGKKKAMRKNGSKLSGGIFWPGVIAAICAILILFVAYVVVPSYAG